MDGDGGSEFGEGDGDAATEAAAGAGDECDGLGVHGVKVARVIGKREDGSGWK